MSVLEMGQNEKGVLQFIHCRLHWISLSTEGDEIPSTLSLYLYDYLLKSSTEALRVGENALPQFVVECIPSLELSMSNLCALNDA